MRPGKRRGLAKNTAQLYTLFTLSKLWMVRGQPAKGWLCPESAEMPVQRQKTGNFLSNIACFVQKWTFLSGSSHFHLKTGLFRLSLKFVVTFPQLCCYHV